MNKNNKSKLANVTLWFAYILALLASVNHLAWAFGKLEFYSLIGWIPALAVDFGLAALAYAIQQRKRAKRQTGMLWLGISAFSVISAFANLLHAVAVVTSDGLITWQAILSIDALTLAKAIILSASLPLLVVYLGEIVSSDDAEAARVADREARRLEKVAEEQAVSLPLATVPAKTAGNVANEIAEVLPPLPPSASQNSQQAAKSENLKRLSELLASEPDLNNSQIAEKLGVSRGSVRNYLALVRNGK